MVVYHRRASFNWGLKWKNIIYPEGRGVAYSMSRLRYFMLWPPCQFIELEISLI